MSLAVAYRMIKGAWIKSTLKAHHDVGYVA